MKNTVKNVTEDLIRPSSRSIGKNLGLMFDGATAWLACWGEKQKIKKEHEIKKFKELMEKSIQSISEENLKEPTMNIVGPAIEAAKFYYEEGYYRQLFANLIAASCDKTKINDVHPAYVNIIKELSPLDAKFLSMFKYNATYPMVELQIYNKNEKTITPCAYKIFYFKDKDKEFDNDEYIPLSKSLDNLMRLGLVIKNSRIHELGYDYDRLKEHCLYKIFEDTKENDDEEVEIIKYRLELTNIGEGFIDTCY